jgi:dual specificity tyrosine-phosphorylation-regulated kinase 2/3/4
MQSGNLHSPLSNPLLHAFFPPLSDTEATTVLNFNLKPKGGSILSQPMPAYQLQNLFPPSDRFPSQSVTISPRSSVNSSPIFSPVIKTAGTTDSFPMTSSQALTLFKHKLTKWEQQEIGKYPIVYCIGMEAEKVRTNQNFKANFGFDDEKGKYRVVIRDHIAYRYEVCEIYGLGTFGVVVKALDAKENQYVALKIVDKKSNAGNEVEILQFIKAADKSGLFGVVDFLTSFTFREHTVIVFEVLSINLYDFLKDSHFEGVSPNLIRRIASQLLQTLSFLHKHQIIHCDLKPENVLFKELNRSLIKLADFGTSCFQGRNVFTYIQSRYYRAPEVILGLSYTTAIDIWSLGCILAELYAGVPIFPGESEQDQLHCIMEYCGAPGHDILLQSHKWKLYFDEFLAPKPFKSSRGVSRKPGSKTIAGFLRNSDNKFVELVTKCLQLDPRDRITAQQALLDPWLLDFSMKVVSVRKEPVVRKLSLTLHNRSLPL